MLGLEYRIKDLESSDKDLSLALSREQLFDAFEDLNVNLEGCSAQVTATLRMQGSIVQCDGSLRGQLSVPCQRCLEPAKVPIEVRLNVVFSPKSRGDEAQDGDGTKDDDDLDYAHHDGETVELWPVLREDLILAVPITVLCKEDCLGLCPMCGADRNAATCRCQPEAPQSPFAARLRQVKLPT